jgi:hypothetical protein
LPDSQTRDREIKKTGETKGCYITDGSVENNSREVVLKK